MIKKEIYKEINLRGANSLNYNRTRLKLDL